MEQKYQDYMKAYDKKKVKKEMLFRIILTTTTKIQYFLSY